MLGNISGERRGGMSTKTPMVSLIWEAGSGAGWHAVLERPVEPGGVIRVDSEAWFGWLEEERTTSFCYPLFDASCGYIVGVMTVRKERRGRGGRYWVVYRRCQGRLRKVYLGASSRLTHEHLEVLAARFLAAHHGREPSERRDGDSK